MELENFLTLHDKYDLETKTYSHSREAGLFSMLNWTLRTVCLLELNGYKVDNIKVFMNEYIDQTDCFDKLFLINDRKLNLHDLPEETKIKFYNETNWKSTGFGNNPKEINLDITNQVISKFFNPTKEVLDWFHNFESYLGGDLSKIIFLWARKTDKTSENELPTVEKYIQVLSELDLENHKVLIQTDDHSVIQEFRMKSFDFITLPQISLPMLKNEAFHRNVRDISEKDFQKNYGVSKIDHLRQMVALSVLAKYTNTNILYPGNPTTFIPLFKGSFHHFLLFENDLRLY